MLPFRSNQFQLAFDGSQSAVQVGGDLFVGATFQLRDRDRSLIVVEQGQQSLEFLGDSGCEVDGEGSLPINWSRAI